MIWRLLTPEQWSALGTMLSAVAAFLNLVVVIILLRYSRNATASAQAQAGVAMRTLLELDAEKKLQDLIRPQGRLKDLGDALQAMEQAIDSVHFPADR